MEWWGGNGREGGGIGEVEWGMDNTVGQGGEGVRLDKGLRWGAGLGLVGRPCPHGPTVVSTVSCKYCYL